MVLKGGSSMLYLYYAIMRLHPMTNNFRYDYYIMSSYVIEGIFAFDMCLNFLKEYTPAQTTIPVSDFRSIASQYLNN